MKGYFLRVLGLTKVCIRSADKKFLDAEFRGIDISITTEEEPKQQIGFEQEASNEACYGATHGEGLAGHEADVFGAKGESTPRVGQSISAAEGNSMKQVSVYTRRKVSDLRAEAQRLIETGQMPTLAQVLEAVAEARKKYADKIIAARKESE